MPTGVVSQTTLRLLAAEARPGIAAAAVHRAAEAS